MPTLFQRLRYFVTGKLPEQPGVRMQPRNSVDAARTTDDNKRHWANADGLGPNATFDSATRQKLRNRGRYEDLNNGYCGGLVRSMAYDLIGTGPRPQISIPGDINGIHANRIELSYAKWARATGLGRKYRLMELCVGNAGEVFGVLNTNRRLKNPIKLDVRLLEAEQCETPYGSQFSPYLRDGILFDEDWNPVEYYFLREHPGETSLATFTTGAAYETVPAERVIHWYSLKRPGQTRGIPRITASLPLFSQLRRYTLATLTAAEFAAMLAGILKTNLPPDSSTQNTPENWNLYELVRGALLTLPQGWDASQFEPNQPTATYKEFKSELLNEAGRGPGAPLNVVTGNSSGYNFSSGRLDHVPYQAGLRIDRDDFCLVVVEPVFAAWEEEARAWSAANASMQTGLQVIVDPSLPPLDEWIVTWQWDGFGSIDPVKDANADDTRIMDGTSSYSETLAEYGQDWRAHFQQLAVEKAYAESLGLAYPPLAAAPAAKSVPADEQLSEPGKLEQAVAMALEEYGVSEVVAGDILASLGPTFAKVRPKINGHRLNGHAVGGRN